MLVIAAIVFNCAIFGALFRPLEPPKPKEKHSTELVGIKEEEPGALVINGNGNSQSFGNVISAQNSASHQNITRTHSVGAAYMKTSSSVSQTKKINTQTCFNFWFILEQTIGELSTHQKTQHRQSLGHQIGPEPAPVESGRG